jgi:tetratricopeptide (TPR) repeat protein
LDQQITPNLEGQAATETTSRAATPTVPEEPDRPVAAERILSRPVNSFALGESLFRTGNYESALKAFQATDTSGMSPSERTWLELWTALCQRKLDAYDDAAGTLREIANEDSNDYPVQAAKWWLKYAESTHENRARFDSLASELDSLVERSTSDVEP